MRYFKYVHKIVLNVVIHNFIIMDEDLHNLDSPDVVQHFNSVNLMLLIPCSILTLSHIHQQCTQWNYNLYISLKTPTCFGATVLLSQSLKKKGTQAPVPPVHVLVLVPPLHSGRQNVSFGPTVPKGVE
jgi:hypothetical protein